MPGDGIEHAQRVGVQFGEPDVAVRIESDFVGRGGERQGGVFVAGIGRLERGKVVDAKLPCGGEVVADVVGVLFGEPDAIVGSYSYAHNARGAMRRRQLLKCVRAWIKEGEIVMRSEEHTSELQSRFDL